MGNTKNDNSFRLEEQPSLMQASLGRAKVIVPGARGLRLTGLNSFHLDEGPDFLWLNIYRVMADATELEVTRDRTATVSLQNGAVEVRWPVCEAVDGELFARYRIDETASAVDVTFGADINRNYRGFELYIANYFTPYYAPQYAIQDNSTHPNGIFWYRKKWFSDDENESWARDGAGEAVFQDGRWQTGHAINWRRGPFYAYPLMIQEHRYGHATLLMARPEDCFGISGLNSYHNSQYFHLFGRDVAAGECVAATVRLVILTKWDDLRQEALARYNDWLALP